MKNRFLFVALATFMMSMGAVSAETVFTGDCYKTTAIPGNGYWVVDYMSTSGFSFTNIPSISTVYVGCTAGNSYNIYPSLNGQDASILGDLLGAVGVVYSCTACADGYELYTYTGPFIYGRSNGALIQCSSFTNIPTINRCRYVEPEDSGGSTTTCNSTNCKNSSRTVLASNPAYLTWTKRACASDGVTCNETPMYTCNYGYYGISGSGSTSATGCYKCPPYFVDGKSYDTTTPTPGLTDISACYVVAQSDVTHFTDETGSYKFVDYDLVEDLPNATRCYYNLGKCSNFTAVCFTRSGSGIETGTKTNSTSGGYCWCNANGKSFNIANMGNYTACNSSCKNACTNAFVGFEANDWTPMISLTDLGC